MATFEYVMVLASIIVGLGLSHLLQGLSRLVLSRGGPRPYWVHLVWVAYMFVNASIWWWTEFRLHSVQVWTFSLYAFVLVYAFLIYLMCAWMFPRSEDIEGGYEDYFYSRKNWFFSLLAAYLLIDVIDTLLKGWAHFMSYGLEYPIATVLFTSLTIVSTQTRNRAFHGAFAFLCFAYQVSWAFRYAVTEN